MNTTTSQLSNKIKSVSKPHVLTLEDFRKATVPYMLAGSSHSTRGSKKLFIESTINEHWIAESKFVVYSNYGNDNQRVEISTTYLTKAIEVYNSF